MINMEPTKIRIANIIKNVLSEDVEDAWGGGENLVKPIDHAVDLTLEPEAPDASPLDDKVISNDDGVLSLTEAALRAGIQRALKASYNL